MIEINLAPAAEGRRAGRRASSLQLPTLRLPSVGGDPRVAGAGAAALLLLLAVGFAFWRLDAKEASLDARVQQEVTDSTRFATTIGLITAVQARQDTIRQKIGIIRGVDQRRFVWPHLLDEISRATPSYTWLTEITSAEASQPAAPRAAAGRRGAAGADTARADSVPAAPVGPAFSLQGSAGSTQALTRFMKNLEASPFIREVTLVTSEQVEEQGRLFHRFTLEARYEIPDSAVIETVPVVTVN